MIDTSVVLKYPGKSELVKREEEDLFFTNGLRVNLKNKDAYIEIPARNIAGSPVSLLTMEDGKLAEKVYIGDLVDVSALLVDKGDTYVAVLAHRELIRSLLFRLYYLKGQGLRFFELFSSREDPRSGTMIYTFRVDWKAFEDTLQR